MRFYATLFDRAYFARGLALYHSLVKHGGEFQLYILALDDETYWMLDHANLPHVRVISLASVEMGMNLTNVRANRSWMEYCWTLASQFMQYIHLTTTISLLTYLDSDLFFFSSPEPIFTELGAGSIAIVPHRFHPGVKARLEPNGIYNVGWLSIDFTTDAGRLCIRTWSKQCRDWCYHRNEEGKFGDQGYLNDWPERYGDECRVIQNIGAGLAPWNVIEYDVLQAQDRYGVFVRNAEDLQGTTLLIFYHFHEFTHDPAGQTTRMTRHPHRPDHKRLIYGPYSDAIKSACQQIHELSLAREQHMERLKAQGERA